MSYLKVLFRPSNVAKSSVVVRGGRLVHWMGSVTALFAFVTAIILVVNGYQSSMRSAQDIQKWTKNNASKRGKDGLQHFFISTTDGHQLEVVGPRGSTRDQAVEEIVRQGTDPYLIEDRPLEQSFNVFEVLTVALIGIGAFLIGRAIRYLLAGE